jgi:hypothetical protein
MEFSKSFIRLQHVSHAAESSTVPKPTGVGAVDLNVNVLTMGNWPTYPVCDVQLPVDMVEYQQVCLSRLFI